MFAFCARKLIVGSMLV